MSERILGGVGEEIQLGPEEEKNWMLQLEVW